MNALADIFYAMDKNGNGIIDVDECTKFLKNVQSKLSEEEKSSPLGQMLDPSKCQEMTQETQDEILEKFSQGRMPELTTAPFADMLEKVVQTIYGNL